MEGGESGGWQSLLQRDLVWRQEPGLEKKGHSRPLACKGKRQRGGRLLGQKPASMSAAKVGFSVHSPSQPFPFQFSYPIIQVQLGLESG